MKRPEITVVNHYDIFLYNHGGVQAIKGLYKELSRWCDVNIIVLTNIDCHPEKIKISKNITVYPIVMPYKLRKLEKENFFNQAYAIAKYGHTFNNVIRSVHNISQNSDIVIAEHVYTWRIIKNACQGKRLWYRAHNVEYDYQNNTLINSIYIKEITSEIYMMEKECCKESEIVLTISEDEKKRFVELYNLNIKEIGKIININAGYDVDGIIPVYPRARIGIKGHRCSGLFVGSKSEMTRFAVDMCIEIARLCPDIQIVIIGSSGEFCYDKPIPDNLIVKGVLGEEEKINYLKTCDFALNLVNAGAGVNIKMMEYFAYGIPVISTECGARGIEVIPQENCIISEANVFGVVKAIRTFYKFSREQQDCMAKNAYRLVMENYTWEAIADKCQLVIKKSSPDKFESTNKTSSDVSYYDLGAKQRYFPKNKFYIRCAGKQGVSCAMMLKQYGIKPVGFVDDGYRGKSDKLGDIPVITENEYLNVKEKKEIIVANARLPIEIAAELVKNKVPIDNISLYIGEYIVPLKENNNCYPIWLDINKLRQLILAIAK